MKSNLLIIILCSLISFDGYGNDETNKLNDYHYIDSLNVYRKDKNNEIMFLILKEPVEKVFKVIDWDIPYNRGLITDKILNPIDKRGYEGYILDFAMNPYSKYKMLYLQKEDKTLFAIANLYSQDKDTDNKIDSLFSDYQYLENILKYKEIVYDELKPAILKFMDKIFLWSEKVRGDFREQLNKDKYITGEQMRLVLNSYQIASGYNTAVGQLLAIRDFFEKEGRLAIENWSFGKDVHIESIGQLRGFIQSYDPYIDIVDGEEFKE